MSMSGKRSEMLRRMECQRSSVAPFSARHEPGVLFGVANGIDVDIAIDHPDPTWIVSVDDVQDLVEGVFHGSTQVQTSEKRQM